MARISLIYALSGLGKSEICAAHPRRTYDTDVALDEVLLEAFPGVVEVGERRRRWRGLCRTKPWVSPDAPEFLLWARTRRRLVAEILGALQADPPRVVFTNLLLLPWRYTCYYGVTLGQYEAHWKLLHRVHDNDQTEHANAYLEGFAPLTRLSPGEFLSQRPELLSML